MNPAAPPGVREGERFRPGGDGLPADACFFLAKGFSRVFWGLLLAMALFFGNASVEVFQALRLPAYVAGSGLAAWGLWTLGAAGAVSPRWRRRVRATLAMVCLQIYFAPFLEWWKAAPGVTFYFLNVLGLLLASMLAFFLVNLLAADACRRLRQSGGQVEALAFAAGVVLLMIAPLALTSLFSLLAALRYQTGFAVEMWQTVIRLPAWVYMVLTLPCSLTLVAVWKIKTLCYHLITEDAEGAGPDEA